LKHNLYEILNYVKEKQFWPGSEVKYFQVMLVVLVWTPELL